MKPKSSSLRISHFSDGESLFRGKYNMKTINSLVLDFEMMVEEEEYENQQVL